MFTDAYGLGVTPDEALDLVVVRLTAMAAHIERQVRAGDPDFAMHRDENHGHGYRMAVRSILDRREALLA